MWGYPIAALKSVAALVQTLEVTRLQVLDDLIRIHKT